jgi:CubicO group peptidase (beta-lactamase class C family)
LRGCFVLLCLLALFIAGCSSPQAVFVPSSVPTTDVITSAYWPTDSWRTSTPEQQGVDSQKLAQMLDAVEQQNLNMHSLLVIRNGYIVSESYFGSYQQETRHELYSCTKSFVSTLVGISLDRGFIDNVSHPVLDFFLDSTFANLDELKQNMTLEDLLTMRSGLSWQEGDPAYGALYRSPDWVAYMLDKPMVAQPGTGFNYCSGCSHVLSAIVQQTTGMNTGDFAAQYLFSPLGIKNYTWETATDGIPIGGWGLQLAPRDMAKLGYLFLKQGQWDGQQIISAGWVQAATEKHTSTDGNLGYGYQWWTYPMHGAYMALGRYGQTIFVAPSYDLVMVTTAEIADHDPIFQLIDQFIFPAMSEAS